MFRFRIGLKWFLLGTVGAAILIAIGKRFYDAWQHHQWLAAGAVAGKREAFNDRQHRQWLAKQKRIQETLRAAGAAYQPPEYVRDVAVVSGTDRRCLSVLAEATALEDFEARTPLNDQDLLWAKNHPTLRGLHRISGRNITNHALVIIGTCRRLQQISIESSSITDEGLAHLSGLDCLEQLNLTSNPVSGRGLAPLARLPRLSVLRLASCPVNDEGLGSISQLRQLELLDLNATKIDGTGLSHLARLRKLHTLHLDNTTIVDSSGLAQLDSVRFLFLGQRAKLRQEILKNVAQMESLETLFLANTELTDDLLAELKDAQQIRDLKLAQTPVTDAGLTYLENLKGLRQINVRFTGVSKVGVRRLANALPRTTITHDGGSIAPSE